jgi:hypothetical protein
VLLIMGKACVLLLLFEKKGVFVKFVFLLFSAALAGCAFSPVERPVATKYVDSQITHNFSGVTKDAAMDMARSALQSSGYEVISYVPELGEVITKSRLVNIPDICDCGTWNGSVVSGNADSMFIINAKDQVDGKVSVKSGFACSTTFSGKNIYGAVTRVETYICASRGVAENRFWEKFREIDMVRRQ